MLRNATSLAHWLSQVRNVGKVIAWKRQIALVFNVMTMIEGVILQEIVLWSLSDRPFLRKLCFPRGRLWYAHDRKLSYPRD